MWYEYEPVRCVHNVRAHIVIWAHIRAHIVSFCEVFAYFTKGLAYILVNTAGKVAVHFMLIYAIFK